MKTPFLVFQRVKVRSILRLMRRLIRLPKVLRPRERAVVLTMIGVILLSVWMQYLSNEGLKPAHGGTFTEGFVEQARFVNPILAESSTDSAIVQLIYAGLTKIDQSGLPVVDMAEKWESRDNGRTYVFILRQDILWHDGRKFTAKDVAYTIDLVKNQSLNSPLYGTWKDVTMEVPSDNEIIFHLKDPLATFPWLTTLGILPSHVDRRALNTTFVGTGPYKYSKVRMRSGAIESLVLVRNSKWYGLTIPYIDAIELKFFAGADDVKRELVGQKILATTGDTGGALHLNEYDIPLAQTTSLFLNSQSKSLTDVAVRKKLLNTKDTFSDSLNLNVVIDANIVHIKAIEELFAEWRGRNVNVTVNENSLETIKKTVLTNRAYDAIIVSVESGLQIDQYAYWHSSQTDGNGLNFSRIKNADLDKLVLEQRKAVNVSDQQAARAKIMASVQELALMTTLSQASAKYNVSKSVHPLFLSNGQDLADRYALIDQWYIKTRR